MNNLDHRDVPSSSEEAERAKFRATYAKMADYELLHLKSQISTLRDTARIALADEIRERDLRDIKDLKNSGPTLEGVRGWLLFFILMMLVLFPLATLTELIQELLYSGWGAGFSGGEAVEYLGDGVLKLTLVALGIRAGLRLWKIKAGAVRASKDFFISMVLYGVCAIAFMFAIDSIGGKPDILFMNAFGAVGNIPGAILGYVYFRRSKRVAATYGHVSNV